MLHFATHGALAGELAGASEPGLILTPPEAATEEDDGYLSASEIAQLKLDADWVILSACNTAAGSTMPSTIYSCSGLELRLANGSTPIEGLSGTVRADRASIGVAATAAAAGARSSCTAPTKRKPLRGSVLISR
jgi:CHAT domain-containing protein